MLRRIRRPSPAMVVALIALFIALGGTATAVVSVVPLATRALSADNAKKLQRKTAVQVAAMPGPASTAVSLISVETSSAVLAPGQLAVLEVSCDSGSKVVSGGWSQVGGGLTTSGGERPLDDDTWQFLLGNLGAGPSNISLYAVCIA